MKRKLLNGLLLATALVGVGTFQSCKDYEADFQNEWKQQNYTLEEEINLLKNRVDELQRIQQQCQQKCDAKFEELYRMLGYWNYQDRGTIEQTLKDLISRITKLENAQPGGSEGWTDEELRELMYKIMIERGWLAGDNGKPEYIDIPALRDKVLTLGREIASMQVTINDLNKNINYLLNLNIDDRLNNIEAWIAAHKDCDCSALTEEQIRALIQEEVGNAIDILKQDISNQLGILKAYVDQQDQALQNQIDNIQTTLSQLEIRLTKAESDAANALLLAEQNKQKIEALELIVSSLQGAVSGLETKVENQAEELRKMGIDVEELKNAVQTLDSEISALDTRLTELETKYDELETQVGANTESIEQINEKLKTFASKTDLENLTKRVEKNEADILALQGDVNKLFGITDRLNRMITGIIVQGTYNPMFGSFSLPVGIKSNILMNYYGEYSGVMPLVFPSVTPTTDQPMLEQYEVTNLGSLIDPITLQNGEIYMDGYMGKVYMTINPSNAKLDGVSLNLESSDGTISRVELQNVQRSWEPLTWGYSRAENDGFYEADAVLPLTKGAINNTNVKLDENLKGAVKDILKDRTRANVFNLMQAVYGQLNQNFPALAVMSNATGEDGKPRNIVSGYDIAAATVRPLSYNTYRGQSIDVHFRHHGPIGDVKDYLDRLIKNDKYHFSINDQVTINGESLTFHFNLHKIDLKYTDDMKLQINIGGTEIVGEDGVIGHVADPTWVEVDPDSMQAFLDQVNLQFNIEGGFIDQWNAQMEASFKENVQELCDLVAEEVSTKLKELEISINDQIDKILNDLKSDIAGKTQGIVNKLNKFLDLYNKAIDKINDFMADPNHYLQVAMVYYAGNGELHRLSNDPKDPTMLKPASGNGIELIATSYSAEIVAPAYKKFVAISDGWDAQGNKLTPAQIQELNKDANGVQILAKTMTGRAKRFAVPTGKMKSGYTYQIVYTAVDYHGYTSVERYYVRMK